MCYFHCSVLKPCIFIHISYTRHSTLLHFFSTRVQSHGPKANQSLSLARQASTRCSFPWTLFLPLGWEPQNRACVVTAVPLALWVTHNFSDRRLRPDAHSPGARGLAGLLVCTLSWRRMSCRLPACLWTVDEWVCGVHLCRCWWHFFWPKCLSCGSFGHVERTQPTLFL